MIWSLFLKLYILRNLGKSVNRVTFCISKCLATLSCRKHAQEKCEKTWNDWHILLEPFTKGYDIKHGIFFCVPPPPKLMIQVFVANFRVRFYGQFAVSNGIYLSQNTHCGRRSYFYRFSFKVHLFSYSLSILKCSQNSFKMQAKLSQNAVEKQTKFSQNAVEMQPKCSQI